MPDGASSESVFASAAKRVSKEGLIMKFIAALMLVLMVGSVAAGPARRHLKLVAPGGPAE